MHLPQKAGSDDWKGGRAALRASSLPYLICFSQCNDALLLGGVNRMTWESACTCEPMKHHEDGGVLVQLGQGV